MYADRGVDGVSMRELAKALGIQAPSIYSHVPSKEALINLCIDPYLKALHDSVIGAATLRAFVREYLAVLGNHQSSAAILHQDPMLRDDALNVGVTATLTKELVTNGIRQEVARPTLAFLQAAAPLDTSNGRFDLILRAMFGIRAMPNPDAAIAQ